MCVCVCVCVCICVCVVLEARGVDAGDRVELGDAALAGGVEALGLAAHLEEHLLLLQLSGELLLQSLRTHTHTQHTNNHKKRCSA